MSKADVEGIHHTALHYKFSYIGEPIEHYYYVFYKDGNYKGSTQECKKKKNDLTKT